jgi:hypothetical protein
MITTSHAAIHALQLRLTVRHSDVRCLYRGMQTPLGKPQHSSSLKHPACSTGCYQLVLLHATAAVATAAAAVS